jgi:hypothetical protein
MPIKSNQFEPEKLKPINGLLISFFGLLELVSDIIWNYFSFSNITHDTLEGFSSKIAIYSIKKKECISPNIFHFCVNGTYIQLFLSSSSIKNMTSINNRIKGYISNLITKYDSPSAYIQALLDFIDNDVIIRDKFETCGFTFGIIVRIGNLVAFKTIGDVVALCIEENDGEKKILYKSNYPEMQITIDKIMIFQNSRGWSNNYPRITLPDESNGGCPKIKIKLEPKKNITTPITQLGMFYFDDVFRPDRTVDEIEVLPINPILLSLFQETLFLVESNEKKSSDHFSLFSFAGVAGVADVVADVVDKSVGDINGKKIIYDQLLELMIDHTVYLLIMTLQICKSLVGKTIPQQQIILNMEFIAMVGKIRQILKNHSVMTVLLALIQSTKTAEKYIEQNVVSIENLTDEEVAFAIYNFDPSLVRIYNISTAIIDWVINHHSLATEITIFASVPADEVASVVSDEVASVVSDEVASVPADEVASVPADEVASVPADEVASVVSDLVDQVEAKNAIFNHVCSDVASSIVNY